jgi:hypothetical protein
MGPKSISPVFSVSILIMKQIGMNLGLPMSNFNDLISSLNQLLSADSKTKSTVQNKVLKIPNEI